MGDRFGVYWELWLGLVLGVAAPTMGAAGKPVACSQSDPVVHVAYQFVGSAGLCGWGTRRLE